MQERFESITNQVIKSDKIIIMSHKQVDLDGFASSLGLYTIFKELNKQVYLYLEEELEVTVKKAYQQILKAHYPLCLYQQSVLITENTLLIVLDTHKRNMVAFEPLLSQVSNIIVLDHHIKGQPYIDNAKIIYIDANLSSTTELIAFYFQYLKLMPSSLIATIMLAGIEVDTNGFQVKTSANTYEIAAYLMRMGADSILKQELLKQDVKTFLKRQEFVKKSVMINEHMILCVLDDAIYEKSELARISEELLQFESVDASFTIGHIAENVIGISARSTGKIDVEEMMKKLDGGGHKTTAATQISSKSLMAVQQRLIEVIEKNN